MANTTVAAASQVSKWDAQFFAEYVRDSGFKPYMGRGSNSVINVKYELASGGKTINIPLVTRLTANGVTGSSTLEGNEEALGNHNHAISIDWLRNAVRLTKDQEHYTEMDLRRAARDQLQNWAMDKLRDAVITALGSVGGVAYGSATASQLDAWLDDNTDRVFFGTSKTLATTAPAGGATNDHSASLLTIANTEKLSASLLGYAKRIAKTANPHIRPMRVEGGREYFVMFANSLAFRDLKDDMKTINADARPRDVESNPIFQDGDLIYDGVIVREIPEIPVLTGVGTASADVSPVYLCGAQALGVAWGQEPRSTTDTFDYGFARGVGIEEARGVSKMVFNDKDHGVVTGFVATAADA
jgi:N4-gp56 family major capsid protein